MQTDVLDLDEKVQEKRKYVLSYVFLSLPLISPSVFSLMSGVIVECFGKNY